MIDVAEIGRRLKSHRSGTNMSIDAAARSIGISRALLYRYEAGDIVKLETLQRLARLYGTSMGALLGSDQDHLTSSVLFFERLEKLEAEATRITTVFGPLAYVLTSDHYEEALFRALSASEGADDSLTAGELARLRRVLRRRKANLREKRTHFVNIVPATEIERFLATGLTVFDMSATDRAAQRRLALKEMEHFSRLLTNPPMGVQIGVTRKPLPTAGFQILVMKNRTLLVNSPFRLGEPLNLRYGVATISGDEQAVRLHESLVARLWQDALTGHKAADEIATLIKASRE